MPLVAVAPPHVLLAIAGAVIVGLIVLIARFKCNAFIALMIASLVMGIASGMPLPDIATSFEKGVGKTMGGLAMIIGLGAVLGKLLAESRAAEVIASTMIRWFGASRIDYAVMVVAFIVGISVFFGAGIVLLGPIAFMLALETRTPILRLALPMAAGLSVAHGLIPPHPGPMAAIAAIHADTGRTILYALLIGAPTALITGPFLARWVSPHVPVPIGGLGADSVCKAEAPYPPRFAVALFTMLLPVLLMLLASAADLTLPKESSSVSKNVNENFAAMVAKTANDSPAPSEISEFKKWEHHVEVQVRQWLDLLGSPSVALLVAVLVAFVTFGKNCGLTGAQILKFSESSLAPVAGILLVIAAGGGFSMVLGDSGVGTAIGAMGKSFALSPLLLGWIIAGMLRIAVGSATVAITTAAGLMAPVVAGDPTVNKELLVLAMGAGSLILSHVNDSGFWFVKEYLGMTVQQTLKTWTVVETGIAVVSIVLILAVNAIL